MKKAIKIVLGVLGAMGLGLVGLILACHFNPGLSDSIADKLYNNKIAESLSKPDETLLTPVLEGNGVTAEGEVPAASDILEGESGDVPEQSDVEQAEAVTETPAAPTKTLEDYGLTQENVINTIPEYFEDCFKQLSAGKGQDIEFYNVVRDMSVADAVLRTYDDNSYRSGFMDQFMDDYKVDTCGWNVDIEQLQEGFVLITHKFAR